MTKLRSAVLAAAALAVGSFMSPAAHANIITGWDFNLTNTACGVCSDITNVKLLTLGNGNSVVTQQLSGGTVFGQTFSEYGLLGIVGGQQVGNIPFNSPITGVQTGYNLWFYLNNVTGYVTPTGQLHFDGGANAVSLYVAPTQGVSNTDPSIASLAGATLLANFNLKPVTSDASLFSVNSNGVPSGSIGLTLTVNTSNPVLAGPLFSKFGNSLDEIAVELANIQPVLNSGVSPNPQNTGGPDGSEQIYLTAQGQVQLAVPEPSTLALFGSALIFLVIVTERRRRKQNAVS